MGVAGGWDLESWAVILCCGRGFVRMVWGLGVFVGRQEVDLVPDSEGSASDWVLALGFELVKER
jgi:hypothetical protein